MPAGTRNLFREKECTRATFITTGMSSSWKGWGPTRAKLRPLWIRKISETQQKEWSSGAPADWVMEVFALARRDAYRLLPRPGDQSTYTLPLAYTKQAEQD